MPPNALVGISTHDLATLAGWWAGQDIRLRLQLGLFAGMPAPAVGGGEAAEQIIAR